MGSCGDDEDGSAEMGGEQDDWMWVCVGWSRGVLWLVRRECVVWFFFFCFVSLGCDSSLGCMVCVCALAGGRLVLSVFLF